MLDHMHKNSAQAYVVGTTRVGTMTPVVPLRLNEYFVNENNVVIVCPLH